MLFVVFKFTVMNLIRLVGEGDLFHMSDDVLMLNNFCILMFLTCLFFRFFIMGCEPILVRNILRTSCPSSAAVLVVYVVPATVVRFRRLVSDGELEGVMGTFYNVCTDFVIVKQILSNIR